MYFLHIIINKGTGHNHTNVNYFSLELNSIVLIFYLYFIEELHLQFMIVLEVYLYNCWRACLCCQNLADNQDQQNEKTISLICKSDKGEVGN